MSTFRLARLLQLREMKVDKAAQELALAHRRTAQAEARSARAQESVAGTDLEVGPGVWQAIVAARITTMAIATETAAAVAGAQAQQDRAATALNEARQAAKPLEKLQDAFHRQEADDYLAAQAIVLDEVGQNMFLARVGGNDEL